MDTDPVLPVDPSGDEEPVDQDDAKARTLRHCSTGKLTQAQTDTVYRWRNKLVHLGTKTSSSDCIAVALIHLLDAKPPKPLDIAAYAWDIRQRLRSARLLGVPTGQPVSCYLPELDAGRADQLLIDARAAHIQFIDDTEKAADQLCADNGKAWNSYIAWHFSEAGLPPYPKVYDLPIGTLARMAIDRWADRDPADVIAAARAHALTNHDQPHRARRDMTTSRNPGPDPQ